MARQPRRPGIVAYALQCQIVQAKDDLETALGEVMDNFMADEPAAAEQGEPIELRESKEMEVDVDNEEAHAHDMTPIRASAEARGSGTDS